MDTPITIVIAIIQVVIAFLSCWFCIKKFKADSAQHRITRLTEIYLDFLELSPLEKIKQGALLYKNTALQFVQELNQHYEKLARCSNEIHFLTLNDNSTEALNLNSAVNSAKNNFNFFSEELTLYINSTEYIKDLANVNKISETKFNTEIANTPLNTNPAIRNFYIEQLKQTENMKYMLANLNNLQASLDDKNFCTHFYKYFIKISS